MVGVAPTVIAKWVAPNPTGAQYAYAPGDTMRVYVQYSADVFVQLTKEYIGLLVTPDLYILLDTGSTTPGKAVYSGRGMCI